MSPFYSSELTEKTVKWLLIGAIAILGVLRFISLDIDPPYFFAGITQAHLTDPYHLTYHARSAVLFDEWTPFDYHRWDVFKNSLVSGTAYLLFSVFGVSRITANLTGLLLNSLGLVFIFWGVRRHRPLNETLLGTFLALLSAMLMFYGRLPFLENGLIFWSGLIYFLFARYHDRRWVHIAVGCLIALAAFSGKLFGFILIVPVIVTYYFIYRKRFAAPSARTLLGMAAGSLLYIVAFYAGDYQTMLSYYREQTTGMYGTPTGFTSLYGFFMNLITYGGESGFFRLSPFFITLGALGSILLLLRHAEYGKFREENIPAVFMLSWLLMGILLLSPFTYRPLRYTLFLFIPLSAISARAVAMLFGKLRVSPEKILLTTPVVFIIILYLAMQIKMTTVPGGQALATAERFLFPGILIAMGVTAVLLLALYKFSDRYKSIIISAITVVLLAATIIFQGRLIYRGLSEPGPYLRDIGREVAQITGPDAILTGPYAPAFTIDNNLKAVIYVFGLPDVEHDLFDKFPITHLAADYSNWQAALRTHPSLADALRLNRFRIRDGTVDLYRIPGANTPLTDFERFVRDFEAQYYDSVLHYNTEFCETYKENLAGQFNLIINHLAFGKTEHALKGLETLAALYPDNYRVTAFASQCYKVLAGQLNKPEYDTLGESFFERSLKINPSLKRVR